MAISSNSIIHYTKSLDILKSILLEGFRIKYCAEDLICEINTASKSAHPMVCFSDIPLSISYSGEWSKYGNYAIGLTKRWASQKGLNPVLYLESNSKITNSITQLLSDRRSDETKFTDKQKLDIIRIKCFSKNYKGFNSHLKMNDYNFYNEREWRYVPDKKEIGNNLIAIHKSIFEKNKNNYNDKIKDFRLNFKHSNISFIIVNTQREVSDMVTFLKTEYKDKFNLDTDEIDYMLTKIISVVRIKNDISAI